MLPLTTTTPKAELDHRTALFQQYLAAEALDGALVLQNTDLYYLAGTIQQAHLYVPTSGAPVLMVRKSLERARAESALTDIVALRSPRRFICTTRVYLKVSNWWTFLPACARCGPSNRTTSWR